MEENKTLQERKLFPFELTGSALKWVAIVLMLLNHLCYAINLYFKTTDYFTVKAHWYLTRIAFFLFAFFISEGMKYTHDRKKYIFSLFLFAIISEIPFDLCFKGKIYDYSSQNVFFTLGLGALAIVFIDYFQGKPFFQVLSVLIPCVIAAYLKTDYSFLGVALIVSFYLFREKKWQQLLFPSLIFLVMSILYYAHEYWQYYTDDFVSLISSPYVWSSIFLEWHGLAAVPLLALYRGTRGRNINKWFFYGFYPGHIFLIWLVITIIIQFTAK